jgi:hypothetical protein
VLLEYGQVISSWLVAQQNKWDKSGQAGGLQSA